MPSPLLIAHRGLTSFAPENSAAALRAAVGEGARAVEFDVRPTADGHLVVLHDKSPKRLSAETRPAAELPARTLLETARIDAPGERFLLLDEALALVATRTLVDIEVKPTKGVPPEELARRVLEALYRAGSPSDVIVTSESEALLAVLAREAPRLRRGFVWRRLATGDPVRRARAGEAELVVANERRVGPKLAGALREAGLELWAYTVDDTARAEELVELGCTGLVTNELESLRGAFEIEESADALESGEELLLAIDLGSTSTKAALVDPREGLVARVAAPTPITRGEGGVVEHDPAACVATVEELLGRLAERCPNAPRAAGLTVHRSSGLWVERGDLAPLSPCVSWRDARGAEIVEELAPRRAELEAAAGMPLDAAWTGIKGAALARAAPLPEGAMLLPLGSFVAARLTGRAPGTDPGLANRTFLLDAAGTAWSPLLLDALGLRAEQLPALVPSVDDHGAIPWPGGGEVPLRAFCGDQQAAYVGAAGPTATRLVLNVGTAGFAMRAVAAQTAAPAGARRAPLWTSARRRVPALFLLEQAVLSPPGTPPMMSSADAARQAARDLALEEGTTETFIAALASAVSSMAGQRDRSVVVTGGGLDSPHLVHRLEQSLPLPMVSAREAEVTLLGAARLAAAGTGLAWSIEPGGGARAGRRLWL